eukprot:7308861-Prymnesium_polylepis.1
MAGVHAALHSGSAGGRGQASQLFSCSNDCARCQVMRECLESSSCATSGVSISRVLSAWPF